MRPKGIKPGQKLPPRPLHDRVLVKRNETEKVKGGIIIPENAQEEAAQGMVIAVGPGSQDSVSPHMSVKPGDLVAFGKYAGTDIVIAGEKLLILREEEIHLIL